MIIAMEAASHDIVTTAQMRAAEAEAIAGGTTGARLMERAGRQVADVISAMGTGADPAPVHILCGPGNNGGDGFVVARVLQGRGHDVSVYSLVSSAQLTGDAALMAAHWAGVVHPPRRFLALAPAVGGADPIIVDALFGTGLSRAVADDAAAMIDHANGLSGVKIAVDIPSGIGSDTGAVMGTAFEADRTITFHALKPGHVLRPGARHCGDIDIADIGLGNQATARARLATDGPEIEINDAAALIARLGTDPDGHKYTRGHTLVLAGGLEGVGAARLAARGALRAGAGLVTIAVPGSALLAHAGREPDALMVRRCDGADGLAELLADRRRNAVVLGPAFGVGPNTQSVVAAALGSGRSVVLDADALTSFAGAADGLAALTRPAGNTILTPHAGEFARLFAEIAEKPAPARARSGAKPRTGPEKPTPDPLFAAVLASTSPLHQALAAAAFFTAILVLKGPATIIAAPDGRAAINLNAPPWLGTAGSGDVLAGIIGSLVSQGLEPFDAACAGVWLHGEAGQKAGRGLIADDLPEAMTQILADVT